MVPFFHFRLELDVFSWLLINCDLFTLNNDGATPSCPKNLSSSGSATAAASEAPQQVEDSFRVAVTPR